MRLREFAVELEGHERSIEYDFHLQTRCVSAHYERCLPRFDNDAGWKILVECVDVVRRERVLPQLGVLMIEQAFDADAFFGADAHGKKCRALEVLHAGVLVVASRLGWPTAPFEEARRCVLAAGLQNRWVWRSPKASPDRRHRAFLDCHHDVDSFRAWLVVQDRRGIELGRGLAIEERPSEFAFVPNMGKVRWSSPDRVVLEAKDGHEVAAIEVAHKAQDGTITESHADQDGTQVVEPKTKSDRKIE